MYLIAITVFLCIAYFVLVQFFSYFFEHKLAKIPSGAFLSLVIIAVLSFVGHIVSYSIPNPELGNRVLHAFGGGFMAFLTCFLVVKDIKLKISKFQFFILSMLIVTALGVGNELLELLLQTFKVLVFAGHVYDTWYDLVSNTVGSLIAAVCFVPYINYRNKKS
jgi:hypothetical protein